MRRGRTTFVSGTVLISLAMAFAISAPLLAAPRPARATVVPAAPTTTTKLASDKNPSAYTQKVTFTAHVRTPSGHTVTGTVDFKVDGEFVKQGVALHNGKATLGTATLTFGVHAIRAFFHGHGAFGDSQSTVTYQTVHTHSTTTTLTSNHDPSSHGQTVTFTARVGGGSHTPTGTVEFRVDGAVVAGSVALSNGHATYHTSTLTIGNHTVRAFFHASDGWAASGSDVLSQRVTQ